MSSAYLLVSTPTWMKRLLSCSLEQDPMSRIYVGLPPTKLLLRLIERLLARQIFPVETTFPSPAHGVVQVNIPGSNVSNCTLKSKYIVPGSFFLFCVEEIRKREAATSRYTPTRSTETRASSPSDSESNSSLR